MKKIAVLITVHNRRETTLQCLKQLNNQLIDHRLFMVEIYLTDDGCTDGTSEAVAAEFPSVHIIQGDGSLFWNRGMYVAWCEAAKTDFDYYFWLNDDTFIYEDTIARLLECSEHHKDQAIVVGSTCAVGNRSRITYGGWSKGKIHEAVSVEQKCETINGNIVLVPKYVYEILGTNDPVFRHAVGDTDYGLRAQKAGVEVWVAKGVLGECDLHECLTLWKDPSQPFNKRWKNFFSPTGNNPFEFFRFRLRHYGFFPACLTFVSNFIHFLFPRLWV